VIFQATAKEIGGIPQDFCSLDFSGKSRSFKGGVWLQVFWCSGEV